MTTSSSRRSEAMERWFTREEQKGLFVMMVSVIFLKFLVFKCVLAPACHTAIQFEWVMWGCPLLVGAGFLACCYVLLVCMIGVKKGSEPVAHCLLLRYSSLETTVRTGRPYNTVLLVESERQNEGKSPPKSSFFTYQSIVSSASLFQTFLCFFVVVYPLGQSRRER